MLTNLKIDNFAPVKGFNIAVARRDPQPNFPRHTHQFTELVIITKGSGIHLVDDREYPIGVGDLFVISGNHEHTFKDMHQLALVNVMFNPESPALAGLETGDLPGFRSLFFLNPPSQRHKLESRLRLNGTELRRTEELVDRLEQELLRMKPGFKAIASALLIELLIHLSRCYNRSENPQTVTLLRLADALNYLEQHYTESIDFQQLAHASGMSIRSFQRAFRLATNSSAQHYLIMLRLNRAVELLKYHNCSVTETAYQVGFADSNYFSRLFKKHIGVAPKMIRPKMK